MKSNMRITMNDLDRGMLQHNKLPDLALDKLMEWIMSGKLSMGDKLNTEELASQLGVSRMPIREALANLEKKGLAESVPYAGTRLVTLTKDDVRQISAHNGADNAVNQDRTGLFHLRADDEVDDALQQGEKHRHQNDGNGRCVQDGAGEENDHID